MPEGTASSTSERILDVAERLVQSRGYNGFSYADISHELGIRKASIHYHFASKQALGSRLVSRYRSRFATALAAIEASTPRAERRLRRFADLWTAVLRDRNRMCLCGMLAADTATLPRSVREELRRFFDESELWLARTLAAGAKAGVLRLRGAIDLEARLLLMAFEGAMLVARSYDDPERFEEIVDRLLSGLSAQASRTRRARANGGRARAGRVSRTR